MRIFDHKKWNNIFILVTSCRKNLMKITEPTSRARCTIGREERPLQVPELEGRQNQLLNNVFYKCLSLEAVEVRPNKDVQKL